MSDDKYANDDPERTLLTLDQLSQTIEVMTSVVNRLRLHLGEQIKAQIESQKATQTAKDAANKTATATVDPERNKSQVTQQKRESFIIELSQPETDSVHKSTKTLH